MNQSLSAEIPCAQITIDGWLAVSLEGFAAMNAGRDPAHLVKELVQHAQTRIWRIPLLESVSLPVRNPRMAGPRLKAPRTICLVSFTALLFPDPEWCLDFRTALIASAGARPPARRSGAAPCCQVQG